MRATTRKWTEPPVGANDPRPGDFPVPATHPTRASTRASTRARSRGPALVAGRYVLLDQIGTGGMGSVWRARDERTRCHVAVKVLGRHSSALLARFGAAHMPPPGGDTIGRRRLDPHLDAFRDLGAEVSGDRWIEIKAPSGGLKPCRIFMDEPSVMGTENALLAAALTEGPTTIGNAASEPHVQDLARMLCEMGAQVDGIGSNVMTVHGRDKLGGADHAICPDHI